MHPIQRIHAPPKSAARREFIGASEIGALLGVSPYATPYVLWADKCGYSDPVEETLPMRIGNALEPVILAEAADELGYPLLKPDVAYVRGRVGANLDGISHDGRIVVECKAWGERDEDEARCVAIAQFAAGEQSKFAAVWWQIQTQIYCSGAELGALAALCGKKLVLAEVPRDDAAITLLAAEAAGFWAAHVATRQAPDPSGADLATVKRVRRAGDDKTAMQVDARTAAAIREHAMLRNAISALYEKKDAAEVKIREALGAAIAAETPDGYRLTRSVYTQQRVDSKTLAQDLPDIVDRYRSASTVDKITIRPPKDHQ